MVAANRVVLTRVIITVIADLHNTSSCSSKLFRPKVSLWSEKCLNKLFGDSNPALRSVHNTVFNYKDDVATSPSVLGQINYNLCRALSKSLNTYIPIISNTT